MRRRTLLLALTLLPPAARAVVVRGHITTPQGVPIPYARVQLIQGTRSVATTFSGADGSYEITSGLSGRFLLLTSRSLLIQIGSPFYAGAFDLLTHDIALTPGTLYPAPPAGTYAVPSSNLLTQATLLPELRPTPATFLLQFGPTGTPSYLYVQGAGLAATQFRLDGLSAEDLGGRFNLSTLSASGLAAPAATPALELTPTPGLPDAEAATLSLRTPIAETLHPTLLYTGDAGNLGTYRNEAVATLARRRTDLLASFARFDTGNETAGHPQTPYHLATTTLNAGYHISAATSLRGTFRQDVSAAALPAFFNITRSGKDANQDLYATATFSTESAHLWSNCVRYGLARKREQRDLFTPTSPQTITVDGITALVTLPTAPPREDQVTDRDEATYSTDYPIRPWLHTLLTLRYQNERALDAVPLYRQTLTRTHFTAVPSFTGDIKHRVLYQASATVDQSQTYGFNAAPSLGLTYAAVQPGPRRFHGSVLRATAATGFREPSALELLSQTALTPAATPRSRNVTFAEDQQILSTLTLTTTYFHHQFSHDYELRQLPTATRQAVVTPTLGYRTQGLTLDLRYRPYPRIQLNAAYTYLASLVENAAAQPAATAGLLTAVVGARPFHRPPQTGSATAQYSGPRLTAAFKVAFASRSDDSTTLSMLQLPNRNLSPAWASLDANASLVLTRRITAFTQLTNLADSRTIAPIGYNSTPFLIRTGLRLRFGSE